MNVAVVRETFPGEHRVALVPAVLPALAKAGWNVLLEPGAGEAAGFADSDFQSAGATIVANRSAAFEQANIVLHPWEESCPVSL